MRTKGIIAMLLACVLLSSCVVSKKKYEMAELGRLSALFSRDSLSNLLADSRAQYAAQTSRCNALLVDTTMLRGSLREYQDLLANQQSANQELTTSLNGKMQELAERERTILQLQALIDEQNQKVRNLLNSVKEALQGFSSDELTVREEDGKIYVAMSEKLLFESGKAVVNEQGRAALGILAEVLNRQTDIEINIEGHTDDRAIKTAVFNDNWDLSVIRATSVVRILTETYGVNPLQILPCGRGEFKPVDTNDTAEGRARNRRTEIILAPRLNKLFQMLQNN